MKLPTTGHEASVRCMAAATADGKIATRERDAARFGSSEDQRRLAEQVAWADALIIAAGTIRAYGTTFRVTHPDLVERRRADGQAEQPVSVVVTRSLDLSTDLPFFTRQRVPRIVATTSARADDARKRFAGLADVIATGDESVDMPALFSAMRSRGMPRILLLGGGDLNFQCFASGLVDELFLTIAPHLFGGRDAPTLLDGDGFPLDEAIGLTLEEVDRVGDELFLRYRVVR
jgi:5-amino-6-(5-phosphoribosylamino)uracil reductase